MPHSKVYLTHLRKVLLMSFLRNILLRKARFYSKRVKVDHEQSCVVFVEHLCDTACVIAFFAVSLFK